jgi:hypothetical protein
VNIPPDFKFTIRGFSPKRMAYVLSLLSLALVPLHSHVSCEGSGVVGGMGAMLVFVAGILSYSQYLQPPEVPRSLGPFALAFVALVAHICSI